MTRRPASILAVLGLSASLVVAALPASAGEKGEVDSPHQQRIVAGGQASQGEYPWYAVFDSSVLCGGSVIAPTWVLTAAHCVQERNGATVPPSEVAFRVGDVDFGQGERLTAAQIVVHPDYNAITSSNDIALVRVNETASVAPIELADADDAALEADGVMSTVIGFGTTSTGGPTSNRLLEVDVPVISDAECRNDYPGLVDATMLCAGSPTDDPNDPGPDSCQGDSGGPLFAGPDGAEIQTGIVSFGNECGVGEPGVYSQVSTYDAWITGVLDGTIDPGDPDPSEPDPGTDIAIRIVNPDAPDDPVATAVAVSGVAFENSARFGVLAASTNYPDALGGTALAYGVAPLLYVDADGTLPDATLGELQRLLLEGDVVYLLGGTAVIDPSVDVALDAAGFVPIRLAGEDRERTALDVAREVHDLHGDLGKVLIAYGYGWADAVSAGQIAAWFGIPVLLTPVDRLGDSARTFLTETFPDEVYVMGGTAVVADSVLAEIEAITGPGSAQRVSGVNRLETGAAAALLQRYELLPEQGLVEEPESIVVVNLLGDGAFADVLAASMIPGVQTGVFAPIVGALPGDVDQSVLDAVCLLDRTIIAIGSGESVPSASLGPIAQAARAGDNCAAG